MIQSPDIEHRPIRVLFDYFEKAVEDLGLKPWSTLLRPGNEESFHKRVVSRGTFLSAVFPPSDPRMEELLRDPERYLRWEPWEDPEAEIWAHYRMQLAILATLMGDREQLRTLAAQLVTEPMNRKLSIAYFLGNLTDGRVGLTYKELPTKAQILEWVGEIGHIRLTSKLAEISTLRFE